MAVGKKKAVHYKDHNGVERTKHCGNAEQVRKCVTWIKRKGYELLGKECIDAQVS